MGRPGLARFERQVNQRLRRTERGVLPASETLRAHSRSPRCVGMSSGPRNVAAALTLLSALLSATYYIFVLAISPGTRPTAILVFPFLFGGLGYAVWAVSRREGRAFLRVWAEPRAYLRTGVMVLYQLSVLAATYLTGPVDASVLTLIGDVAATPLVAALLFSSSRSLIGSGPFAAGLLVSLAGGTLTIVGGQSLSAIPPLGWIVVPAVPIGCAVYVVLSAHANERAPSSAVVGQSMLGAGVIGLIIAPVIPGSWAGLVPPNAASWGVLIALGVTAFFVAPVLYFAAIRHVGPALPAVLMTGIPVFTLLLSWVVLGLSLPLVAVLGIPIAVMGGLLALQGANVGAGNGAPQGPEFRVKP